MKRLLFKYLLPSLYNPIEVLERWILSFLLSFMFFVFALFLAFSLRKKNDYVVEVPPPPLLLDYIVIKDEVKPMKKIVKPKPIPKVEKIEKPIEEPKAEAEIEPTQVSSESADIVSKQNIVEKKEPTQTVRIISTADLDNTDFMPFYNPKPKYPKAALFNGIEGYVDIDLMINQKGQVTGFSIAKVYGYTLFGSEVAKVIPKWKFPPPRIGGKKVKVKYLYRINFHLN